MKNQRLFRYLAVFAAATAFSAAAAGCHHGAQATKLHAEKFAPDDEPHAVHNFAAAQAAAGDRADATLHGSHFNAQGVNSLGREKLDLMLRAEEAPQPLVVYLDLTSRAPVTADAARQSVGDYLKGRGLPESQIKLIDGPNPGTTHSASEAGTALKTLGQSAQNGAPVTGDKQGAYAPGTPEPQPAGR